MQLHITPKQFAVEHATLADYAGLVDQVRPVAQRAARPTILKVHKGLSEQLGRPVILAMENMQETPDGDRVGSFKSRGAACAVDAYKALIDQHGGTTASAGNHAQGVANAIGWYALESSAEDGKILATIYMPRNAPQVKIDNVQKLGKGFVQVILEGDSFPKALAAAKKAQGDKVFIGPYDDPYVVAGQGSLVREICAQVNMTIAAILVPVGGAGLAAGTVVGLEAERGNTNVANTKVICIEPEGSASLHHALNERRKGKSYEQIKPLRKVDAFAGGVAVAKVGKVPLEILEQAGVKDVMLVSRYQICQGIKTIHKATGTTAEPSGAVSIAALEQYAADNPGNGALIVVVSGGNADFDSLGPITRYMNEVENLLGLGFDLKQAEKMSAYVFDRPKPKMTAAERRARKVLAAT